MASTSKKTNSINDQAAQAIRNNQNVIELLSKLDQSLHSNDSFVTLKVVDQTGKETTVQFPTVGFFKQELDRISKTLNILTGIEGNPASVKIAENVYKRIATADLNFEPKQINGLAPVSVFKQNPNWIFDSFLNPKISVEIDLTDKIDQNIKTIQSRRFIVEFDKQVTQDANNDDVVTLTTLGQARQAEFDLKYKGKSNVDIVEFVKWLDSPGLINRVDDTLIDEDYFRVEPNRLQFKGNFTVLSTETDTVNKKLWYVLDTLTYYDVSDPLVTKSVELKVGDLVNVNPNVAGVVSTTVYKVIEISTITSEFRVRFEAVYGEEPIPIRTAALSYYSQTVPTRKVRISIGFDEHCVVFLRSIDDDNNLIGRDWSSGIGFWTNELKLDNAAGEQFSDFYIKNVYDYGLILEDLVQKKVPNSYGLTPNAPVLDLANFRTVQVNEHLTNTVEAEQIRDLHNNKNNLNSEIQQLQQAIDRQNRVIETTVFDSPADRKRAEDDLSSLQNKLKAKNETKASTVQNILASQKNLNKISPEYHVRGFWPMPDPVSNTKTLPQEVVQFEVWYLRTNKSGAQNPIATFDNISNSAARSSAPENTTVNQNLSQPKTVNASFSNWQKFLTDARKRTQDPITKQWKWEIQDVSSADTPNINQLDIVINPGEVIQIKIKSLSEAGFPEAPMESDFSNTIEVEFPDNLNNVLSDDQFILKEASADDIKVNMEKDLDARGLNLHLNSSLTVEDIYYAHKADAIASGFKDNGGKIINLYEYLGSLLNKISALEELVNRTKGVLDVYIINGTSKTKVFNGNTLQFNINLEDYMIKTKIGALNNPKDAKNPRTYKNDIYTITDYKLQIVNSAATGILGLLSNRNYAAYNGGQSSPFTYKQGTNTTPQAMWLDKTNKALVQLRGTSASGIGDAEGPRYASQSNNQWIWLQVKDFNGNNIYSDVHDESSGTTPLFWEDWQDYPSIASNRQVLTFIDVNRNSGLIRYHTGKMGFEDGGSLVNASADGSPTPVGFDITDQKRWTVYVPNVARNFPLFPAPYNSWSKNDMATTIHPVITSFTDVTDTSAQQTKLINPGDSNSIIIPLNIYFRAYTGAEVLSSTGPVPFIEGLKTVSGGDMPDLDPSTDFVSVGNKLQIQLNTPSTQQVGDKIVMAGMLQFGPSNVLYNAEGIPLTITAVAPGSITVDFNYPTPTTPDSQFNTEIIQVHAKSKKVTNSSELTHYSVYGALPGQDTPYVRSYVEIATANTAPSPQVHNKKLRFYMENDQSIRPIEFQFNWTITQYKKISNNIVSIGTSGSTSTA